MRIISLALLLFGCVATLSQARDPEIKDWLVTIEPGTMPVLLSAPHGGREAIPSVPVREGKNIERFVTSRDANVDKIAQQTAKFIEQSTQQRPYLVIARFERKYVDANRAPEAAYEHATAKLYYDHYHTAIKDALAQIKTDWGRGIIIDIHGQDRTPDGIYRGTVDGESVKQLVTERGRTAVVGEKSLFGIFAKQGYKVLPGNQDADQVEKFYNGGHITRSYGSHQVADIDAIQIEYGSVFRENTKIEKTSRDLATAIQTFAKEYLPLEKRIKAKAPSTTEQKR